MLCSVSLGALSAKASQLAAQADTEQSILKRARVEAKLAELNMMRQQIIAQLSSDKKHAERMAILRKAIARDPHNKKLRHRLKHDEMEEQERRELLLHVARSGDTCGPCRAR